MPNDQVWRRLQSIVDGMAHLVTTYPAQLATVKVMVESCQKVLAAGPSKEGVDELNYQLPRIEGYVAQWRPRPGYPAGYQQPTWSKETDRHIWDARQLIRQLGTLPDSPQSPEADKPVRPTRGAKTSTTRKAPAAMKIFVSHSGKDRDVASAFVELVRAALPLVANDIRCTSVDGYKLHPGADSDQQLKQEVFQSEVFVALLSPTSLGSIYVLFELGARWGSGKRLLPLMISGAKPNDLKPPLAAIHAGSAVSEGDLHQLVATMASYLDVKSESPSVYLKALKGLLAAAKAPRP